jgi:hypothetical protein
MVEHSYRTRVRFLVSMETGEDQLCHPNRNVGVSSQEILVGIRQRQLNLKLRVCAAKVGQHRGQDLDPDNLAARHSNRALLGVRRGRGGADERLGDARHRLGIGKRRYGRLRGRQPRLRPREEHRSEDLFELLDLTTNRGLSDPEAARRAGEAASAHYR